MIVITKPQEMQAWSQMQRLQNKRIGFVPTMGCLHAGHLSLVDIARKGGRSDLVVMSIFVNPLQFGPNEDFERYPRTWEQDKKMAEEAGVDIMFYPSVKEMYPENARTIVEVDGLGKVMCGVSRPTHFRGVTTVVAKLFSIVLPHTAVFGQKDAQQFFVIRRMTEDLQMNVELIMAPIVREKDGLAMSSRNIYLNADERAQAVCLSQALELARKLVQSGEKNCSAIIKKMREHIEKYSLAKIEYINIVETETLRDLVNIAPSALIALAVHFGKTRLIDNVIL
jgi:pantoate--beta-alanine ligase